MAHPESPPAAQGPYHASAAPSLPPSLAAAERVLRDVWGFAAFRPHQRRLVVAVLQRRDCLAILPTGGGKSLCYQAPAMVLPGVAVVVSPLISLMEDQVGALRARGVPAAYLSSTQTPECRGQVLDALRAGRLRLLYAAPERLRGLHADLARLEISLFAVDEAHCISEWGHEFRPDYREVGHHRTALGSPPTLALTATATPATRADILEVLGLRRPVVVTQSFDRPNLQFEAYEVHAERARLREAASRLGRLAGSGIVYVQTRDRADGVATVLRQWGLSALPYHAALPGPARRGLLTRFLDGRCRVIVATSAFGMGIDKADVRLVVHLGVPARPEAYFQEAGRAGRDGQPASCLMLWMPGDFALAQRLIAGRGKEPPSELEVARQTALRAMRRYATTRSCRRRVLLEYLGDDLRSCAGCDRCGLRVS